MSTVDVDFVDADDFNQRDLKASLQWVQDSGAVGHFNVANSEVIPGCLIKFADLTTATILSKSGDGTGASSVTLSAAHASDSSLVSITALIMSSGSLAINHVYGTESTVGLSSAGNESGGAGAADSTVFGLSSLTNGYYITKVGVYSSGTSTTCKFKLVTINGANYDVTDVYTTPSGKTSAGYQEWTLPTPYLVPSSGTHYLGYYVNQSGGITYNSDAAGSVVIKWKSGDQSGTAIGSWNTSGNEDLRVKATLQPLTAPTNLYVAITTSGHTRTDCSQWSNLNSVGCTQNSVGYKYVAVRFDTANTWYVYAAGQRAIVQFTTVWQYKDSGGSWQDATINSELGALAQAMGVTENQMTATQFAALSEANLATLGWSVAIESIDIAIGLKVG